MPTKRPKRPFPCSGRFEEAFALFNVCCERNFCDLFHINRKSLTNYRKIIAITTILMLLLDSATACGPGRGGGRRRSPRKLTPLVFKQHVPNVSENTLGASGLREGKITREDHRFRELVPNYNSDIIFKDEEGTGADRLMSQRLKEKLNTLAISVMNQWPGVKLRVTEGWDEEGHHAIDSLHYEGRAVDITTSDRDRSKYGMLARLAVEAGFDWVYYESRYHIHVSVKSEKSDAGRSGGCFDGHSTVTTRDGTIRIDHLRVGDEVLSVDHNGQLVFSEVIMFLDRQPNIQRLYYHFDTENGATISLTESHLIYAADSEVNIDEFVPTFARNVRVGQYLYTSNVNTSLVKSDRITDIRTSVETGAFAPLTKNGAVLVNRVLASCYAVIDDQRLAHLSFLPIRLWTNLIESLQYIRSAFHFNSKASKSVSSNRKSASIENGVHWYAKMLYSVAKHLIPSNKLY